MKSKKWLSVLMVFILIFALSTTAFAAPAPKPVINRVLDSYEATELTATNKVADLMASQNTDVGDLYINSMGGNVYLVTYRLTSEGYFFGEIHFEAISDDESGFTDDSAIIYSSGGIVPGKLTVKESFDMPDVDEVSGIISGGTNHYSFIYTSGAPVDSFAAHSVVCLATAEAYDLTIVGSRTETGYIASGAIEGQVVEVREPFGYPDPTADYTSVWDTAFSASPVWASKLIASGAEFVWNYELSSGLTGTPVPTSNDLTVRGDVCNIDLDVAVPSDATGISATLYIVADNGYMAKIGDSIINSAGFNAEAYAALSDSATDDLLDGDALLLEIFPNLTAYDTKQLFVESVVPSNAWNSMIAVGSNVPLAAGSNIINIAAMNEQMDGGNDYNNPAGVIFFIEYEWIVPTYTTVTRYRLATDCETAWGVGEDAEGSNWSQIITDIPTCPAPLLINGGFEAPILSSSWASFPTGTENLGWIVGWAAAGNLALELQSESTVGLLPDEGTQYAELDGTNSVSIYQDINTCPFQKYSVSFAWSPRAGSGTDSMEVFWNGISQGIYTRSADVQGWETVTLDNLTPDIDGNTRLEFKEVGTSNTYGMFLDDVTIDFYVAP